MDTPALVFGRLRAPAGSGRIGVLPGGPGVHFARFLFDAAPPALRGAPPHEADRQDGTVPGWLISNLVAEGTAPAAARTWTYLEAEQTGLANLARVHPLGVTLNTAFARSTIVAATAGMRTMQLGFSDRAAVYLNGRPIFAGARRLPLARLPLSRLDRLVGHGLPAARARAITSSSSRCPKRSADGACRRASRTRRG